ncbi:ribonucleotide reductase (RNR) inhibitor family [Schizosaccharomyces osmophilus]|uniref:Ribonucleotide reductase (RNR) inhibitor family n=1 Tax=Schizosaccharomyces osmophilus TaxID=2545709 RepID=A0AAE9WBD7_9SCHI|nr:ribonucleotide reductase (RNR) inhibitor family [Schizosaccharomyces osmophilus]WBW72336.1 ribonucleotide reductase (RNR) inhibitor family [Schizosaccharomyces osmophilus]
MNSQTPVNTNEPLPPVVQTSLFDVGARVLSHYDYMWMNANQSSRKAVQTGYKFDQHLFPSYHKDKTVQTELPQQKHDPSLRLTDLKSELAADSIFWDTATPDQIAQQFANQNFLESH